MNKITKYLGLSIFAAVLFASCSSESSSTTGWEFNDPENGGFEVFPFTEQETGPGLVLIEGGTFQMGLVEQDVMYDWNNDPRRVTVSSFYMDECEISNLNYLEYLNWLERVFVPADLKVVYDNALPDENVWRKKMAREETYVEYYLRYPAFQEYPVVGVSWLQAVNYAAWRTDRVNERILVDMGFANYNVAPSPEGYFNTDAYLTYGDNAYESNSDRRLQYITSGEYRNVKMEDGILLPKYRLPTEAEWEYAAYGLIGNTYNERVLERRIYPWNGSYVRTEEKKYMGDNVANLRRGRGDYMGVASHLNDAAEKTAPVKSFWPNDYGLYNMGGNVAEWVLDVYRPNTALDAADLNPFRGNYYETKKLLEDGTVEERDSVGRVPMVPVSDFKNDRRRNYRTADNKNFLDGDWASVLESDRWIGGDSTKVSTDYMYRKRNEDYKYSLVGDNARVVKGGSWKDLQYWAAPGQRRYLDEDEATDYIGFRCAMARLGPPTSN